jgi:D-sedoheptulose 7-phosphate isomerase
MKQETENSRRIAAEFAAIQAVQAAFATPDNFARIAQAAEWMAACLQNGGRVLACGNGGSMADAMHFAEELSGRFREDRPALAGLAIADPGHLSCVANDYGYREVFARYIAAHGRPGDVLLAISTSGNSENILRAVQQAHSQQMRVVGLTGHYGGELGRTCDLEIRVPHAGYADRIQEVHIQVIHCLIGEIETLLFGPTGALAGQAQPGHDANA